MKTNQLWLQNDNLNYLNTTSLCNNCKTENLINIISKTNSNYLYCNFCELNKESSLNQYNLDMILLEIKNHLNTLSNNILLELKIDVHIGINCIDLFINDLKISHFNFSYKLSNKELYYFKNTILYLVNDYLDASNVIINLIRF